MDLNWCTVCGRHTSGDLYCSSICLALDGGSDGSNGGSGSGGASAAMDIFIPPTTIAAAGTDAGASTHRRESSSDDGGRMSMGRLYRMPGGSEPGSPRSADGASGSPRYAPSTGGSPVATTLVFPSLVETARGRSPPSTLLDEIRQYRYNRQHRDLPRRRGLPFWEEIKADRVQERRRFEAAENAVRHMGMRAEGRAWP